MAKARKTYSSCCPPPTTNAYKLVAHANNDPDMLLLCAHTLLAVHHQAVVTLQIAGKSHDECDRRVVVLLLKEAVSRVRWEFLDIFDRHNVVDLIRPA